jgi:MFS family permease
MMTTTSEAESTYAWVRLAAAITLGTIGGVGMWSFVVVLPAVQAEFGVTRAWAAVPYTATMLGFGAGGVLMGKLSDRYGIALPIVIGACALLIGYTAAAHAQSVTQFALAQGLLIGLLGSSAVFAPMMADISRWFTRRRGIAVGICASGSIVQKQKIPMPMCVVRHPAVSTKCCTTGGHTVPAR